MESSIPNLSFVSDSDISLFKAVHFKAKNSTRGNTECRLRPIKLWAFIVQKTSLMMETYISSRLTLTIDQKRRFLNIMQYFKAVLQHAFPQLVNTT